MSPASRISFSPILQLYHVLSIWNFLISTCTIYILAPECLKKELPVLRKMAGLTQKDLGEILGVSRQTITNIENGTGKLKWSLFLAAMFIFSLDHNISKYLKNMDMPYSQLKEWLNEKRKEEK